MGPVDPDVKKMPMIGSLYCLDLDGSLRTVVKDVGISNGLAWTEDAKTMYYIDSTPQKVYRYDFDIATGNICKIDLQCSLKYFSLPGNFILERRFVYKVVVFFLSFFVANQSVIVDHAGKPLEEFGFPDGMTIDTEGKLWVACFSASKVIRYDPNTGAITCFRNQYIYIFFKLKVSIVFRIVLEYIFEFFNNPSPSSECCVKFIQRYR